MYGPLLKEPWERALHYFIGAARDRRVSESLPCIFVNMGGKWGRTLYLHDRNREMAA